VLASGVVKLAVARFELMELQLCKASAFARAPICYKRSLRRTSRICDVDRQGYIEDEKERRDRHNRGGRAESPGFCPSIKIDQGLPAVAETLPIRDYYEGYVGRKFVVMCVPWDVAEKLACIEQRGFISSKDGGLGA
jgi:hypothetical protein